MKQVVVVMIALSLGLIFQLLVEEDYATAAAVAATALLAWQQWRLQD